MKLNRAFLSTSVGVQSSSYVHKVVNEKLASVGLRSKPNADFSVKNMFIRQPYLNQYPFLSLFSFKIHLLKMAFK